MRTLLFCLSLLVASCKLGYVVSSSANQADLLAHRRDSETLLRQGVFTPEEAQRLFWIQEIKRFGKTLGLAATKNYDTVAFAWKKSIWNVSACPPLSFAPRSWWFPIVGRVPYLGFFSKDKALHWKETMEAQGDDVYVRETGAYSTLGWFRDPVLPKMLGWGEAELAEVVLHELSHATLWIPGSVNFNESFANFVGRQAMHLYLKQKYREDSSQYVAMVERELDSERFTEILVQLYQDLDDVYQDTALSVEKKLQQKEVLYASLADRIRASRISQKERLLDAIAKNPWNNARLMQFKTYNTKADEFLEILRDTEGDLLRFIERVGKITKGKKDPFAAIAAEAKRLRVAR